MAASRSKSPRRRPPKPLWTCPKCGRQFVSANKYHTCARYSLDDHFAGKALVVRSVYDQLVALLQSLGPISIHPLKTRIVFQSDTQFAAAVPRKNYLELYAWLRRRAAHPRLHKVEMGVYRDYGHIFRLTQPGDLDDDLLALLQEAYFIGCQPQSARR